MSPASSQVPRFCTRRCPAMPYAEHARQNALAGTARPRLSRCRPGPPRGRGYLGACEEPRFTTACRKRRRQRPSNGSDVKLRGQGPRGYGRAARRLPACESRDADGVTRRKLRRTRRLGRRTEAGPRQLLRRVSRPIRPPANRRKQGLEHLERIKSDWPTTKIDTYLKYALGIGAIAYPQMKHVLAVWVQA